MCRTAFIALVLAALSVTSANGLPVRPARSHKSAPAVAASHGSHPKTQHPAAQAVRHSAGRHVAPSRTPKRQATERPRKALLKQSSRSHRAVEATLPDPPPVARPISLRISRLVMPPPLFGSHESLERQNEKTEADGLERILDESDLADRIARKMLVPVPASAALAVNGNLPENHRYCRPWTANFLSDLARAHAAQFHRPLIVSSAVRTVEYQKQLMESNGNAAAAEGDIASPHLTGATIDIAKQGLSRRELGWMRAWLLSRQNAETIDVEEEFQQSCFHITVYKSYVPPKPVRAPKPKLPRPEQLAQIAPRGR